MFLQHIRHQFVQTRGWWITRVIGQCLGGPIFTWRDQVPDETFDVLVSTVMQQAVGQEGPADRLHISLLQGALEATMSQNVTPPAPTEDREENKNVLLWIKPTDTNKHSKLV